MTERKLLNPEYADSQERMNVLRNLIIDGKDAEAVIRYANQFEEECKNQVLNKALNNQNVEEAALEYRVASKFMEMLRHAAEVGKKKEEILQQHSR